MITDMNGITLEVGLPVAVHRDGQRTEGVLTQIFLDQPTTFRNGVLVEVDFDGVKEVGASYKVGVIIDDGFSSLELLQQECARQAEVLDVLNKKMDNLLAMVRPSAPSWKPSEGQIVEYMEVHGVTWEEAHGKLLDERTE